MTKYARIDLIYENLNTNGKRFAFTWIWGII